MATPFRDSFENCPRCGTELVDARDARGCQACGGVWIEEAVLTEMIVEMMPPASRVLGRLVLAVVQRSGEALACPTCGEAMVPTTIHRVELDSCAKRHGVWFDADELRIALLRVADHTNPPLVIERREDPTLRPPTESPPPLAPPPSSRTDVEPGAPRLVFRVTPPGGAPYEIAVQRPVVKLGKLASSNVRLSDENVSRMHAVIDTDDDKVLLIDLGSVAGTLVNGERVDKRELVAGDRLQLAGTVVELLSITPGA